MPTGDFQVRANGFGQRFRRQGILHIEMPWHLITIFQVPRHLMNDATLLCTIYYIVHIIYIHILEYIYIHILSYKNSIYYLHSYTFIYTVK